MRLGSLFTGIGAFDAAWQRCGGEIAWQIENDPSCNRVLERHWPEVRRYGDIRGVDPRDLEPVDVMVGGFPCTDVSVAGRRAGLAGTQSGLWWEFHRLIAALRPDWVCIENVPGLRSSFSPVEPPPSNLRAGARWEVEETSDLAVILSSLGELRYWWAYRVLDSRYWDVAQRRQRVFIVASTRGWAGSTKVLFEPESCEGHPPSRRAAGTRSARGAEGGPGQLGIANALTSHHGRNDPSEETLVYQCQGTNVGEMGALRCGNGHVTGGVPFVVGSVTPLMAAGCCGSNGASIGRAGDPAMTLDTTGSQAIAFDWQASAGNDRSWRGKGRQYIVRAGKYAGALSATRVDAVATEMVVRRLMPVECERLMSLPDNWTEFDAAGRPISDSVRYRLLGNSLVVNVAEWIFRRLLGVASTGGKTMTNPTDARRPDIAALRAELDTVNEQLVAFWRDTRLLTTNRLRGLDGLYARADELLRAIREAEKDV